MVIVVVKLTVIQPVAVMQHQDCILTDDRFYSNGGP